MRRAIVLGSIVAAWAVSVAAAGLGSAQAPNVAAIAKVKDNLYVVTGGGGNTAAFVTRDGVVLVDTKLANWGQAILDQVRTVTDKPVTHIINTHTHGDHVGSNAFFPATVDIVAQANTAANMRRMDAFRDPAAAHGLPDRTFDDRMTLLDGPDAIDLYYFGRAHTGGDAFVVFRALRAMHSGDAFAGPQAPIIDVNNGGSGVAYAETLAKAAAGITGVDTIIPGHSGVTGWQALLDYRDFMTALVASARASHAAGRTPAEAVAALDLPARFSEYAMQRAQADIEVIYRELQR
ncbi:MAG: MBL fold metallo-hydrolase [Vicinamibacterales bacterium]